MNTLNYGPLSRFAVGFEDLFREMDKLNLNSNPAYPPYNIVSVDENKFQIELAVAGFADSDLDITLENGVLTITGEKEKDEEVRNFIHKGIAMRNFTRTFRLATHIEVEGADLKNGLLVVTLKRHIPEELKPKKIAISQN